MRRITISLDDDLARMAEAAVRAGRAPSVSAWIADAVRAKARARDELIAELVEMERRDPASPEAIASLARTLGVSRKTVEQALKGPRRKAGARRAA